MKLTEHSIQKAIASVALFSPSSWAREDSLHRAVNKRLIDLGLDTISCDDLADFIEADGYQLFLDASGRRIWRGIGLLSGRNEENIITVCDEYPIRFTPAYITNRFAGPDPLEIDRDAHQRDSDDDELDF